MEKTLFLDKLHLSILVIVQIMDQSFFDHKQLLIKVGLFFRTYHNLQLIFHIVWQLLL